MTVPSRGLQRLQLVLGALGLGAGAVLGAALANSPPARQAGIPFASYHWAMLATALGLGLWGAVTIAARRRAGMLQANLALLSLALVAPLLGEAALRAGIALGVPAVRDPRLYASPWGDDDHFKLRALWGLDAAAEQGGDGAAEDAGAHEPDPLLGWIPRRTEGNPLGLMMAPGYPADPGPRPVLFFGDSFVAGAQLDFDDKIPQQLGRLLPGRTVLNYGVGGYGLDQIVLRFQVEHARFRDPTVLLGVLTTDIDRCVLTFRNAAKPWFRLEDGRLVLHGVPVEADPAAFLRAHPPRIRSYLGAALLRGLRYVQARGRILDADGRRAEKEALARALVAEAVREARAAGLELHFVVFSGETGGGWRKAVLLEAAAATGHPAVDAEAVWRAALPPGEAYSPYWFHPANKHPNQRAAATLARALAEHLHDAAPRAGALAAAPRAGSPLRRERVSSAR